MSKERTMAEMHDMTEKACAILHKTKDGDLLDPQDLKRTELAVNGCLNDAGQKAFEMLYQSVVVDGTYTKPCLHDIEHITRDHNGYIYYKGIRVEHYDHDYVYSEDAKNSLMELKCRCEFLERKGVAVTGSSVVWGWDKYADEYGAERQEEMDALLGRGSECLLYSRVELYNSGREYAYFVCGQPAGLEDIKNHPVTQSMIGRYFDNEYDITVKPFIYGTRLSDRLIPADEISNRADVESLLGGCHGHLQAQGLLDILPEVAYKTDFAEGYDKAKLLDGMIGHPGRSLTYSEVLLYGHGYGFQMLYFCGAPSYDEIKARHEYAAMLENSDGRMNVSSATYQYGNGDPLTDEEMNPLMTAPFTRHLGDTHCYLLKHGLSHKTGWEDFTRGIKFDRTVQAGQEDETEDGHEP